MLEAGAFLRWVGGGRGRHLLGRFGHPGQPPIRTELADHTSREHRSVGLALEAHVDEEPVLAVAVGSGGPLTEALSYRFDTALNRSAGWMERGESSSTAVSGTLRLDASDRLSFMVTHDYTDVNPRKWFGVPPRDG